MKRTSGGSTQSPSGKRRIAIVTPPSFRRQSLLFEGRTQGGSSFVDCPSCQKIVSVWALQGGGHLESKECKEGTADLLRKSLDINSNNNYTAKNEKVPDENSQRRVGREHVQETEEVARKVVVMEEEEDEEEDECSDEASFHGAAHTVEESKAHRSSGSLEQPVAAQSNLLGEHQGTLIKCPVPGLFQLLDIITEEEEAGLCKYSAGHPICLKLHEHDFFNISISTCL